MLGWGRLSGSGSSPDILQQAEIPIVSHEECKKKYNRYDSKAHLCAGQGHSGGSGGCQGDSGGPLVCEKDGTWFLHGAVSFGKRGCPTKYNTVFARITTYIPWIMDKLGKGYMSICSALSLTAFFVNSTPQLPCHQEKGLKKEINADSLKVLNGIFYDIGTWKTKLE